MGHEIFHIGYFNLVLVSGYYIDNHVVKDKKGGDDGRCILEIRDCWLGNLFISYDMNRDQYNSIPAVNFSLLKLYLTSPAHFKFAYDNQAEDQEDTAARKLGRAIHAYALDKSAWEKKFVKLNEDERPVPDKNYQNRLNADWKKGKLDFYASQGLTVLSTDEYDQIEKMGASLAHCKEAMEILRDCETEKVVEWTDPESGVKCKGIVDFYRESRLLCGDLKSMESAAPRDFEQFITKYLTYMQLAFYMDGLRISTGKEFNIAFVAAVEKKAPYVVQMYYLDERALEAGRTMYKSLLNLHKKCVEANSWPGYNAIYDNVNGYIIANLPEYVYNKIESNTMLQNN